MYTGPVNAGVNIPESSTTDVSIISDTGNESLTAAMQNVGNKLNELIDLKYFCAKLTGGSTFASNNIEDLKLLVNQVFIKLFDCYGRLFNSDRYTWEMNVASSENPFEGEDIEDREDMMAVCDESVNWIKSSVTCDVVGRKFKYYKVRELLVNNIENHINHIIRIFNFVIDRTDTYLNHIENNYNIDMSWTKNNSGDHESYIQRLVGTLTRSSSSDEDNEVITLSPEEQFKKDVLSYYGVSSEGDIDEDDVSEVEAFWILNDSSFEDDFLTFLSDCTTELEKCITTENEIKPEIIKWLNMGTEFNVKLSVIENVNMANNSDFNRNENLFDKMKDTQEYVGIFTKKMEKSIEIANKIKTEYPDSYPGRQSMCYRDLICNWMDMKSRCEKIYDNIKTSLERISDDVIEVDDSDADQIKYINYFNYYQQKDGDQKNCEFNTSKESTDGSTITIQDNSGNIVLGGKKVEYCSKLIDSIDTIDNKITMTIPDASGYRATVLCKIVCSFKNCPQKGDPTENLQR